LSGRNNKAAAAEFRELVGLDFKEFSRLAPVRLLPKLGRHAAPIDIAALWFAGEHHPLFHQQRARLERAVQHAWQVGGPEYRRQVGDVVKRWNSNSRP
jgi:hypothetical protein